MESFLRVLAFAFLALLFVAQSSLAESLEEIEDRIKAHAEAILGDLEGKESKVKSTIEQEEKNWSNKNYTIDGKSIKGPEEHPWLKSDPKGVNTNSKSDYQADSKNAWDDKNFSTATWSCFEPQLVAYGDCEHKQYEVTWDTAVPELSNACRAHCCTEEEKALREFERGVRPIEPDDQGHYWKNTAGSGDGKKGAGTRQEYYEVIQFWWPENQAAINGYGRMRVNPEHLSGEQQKKFTRQQLLEDKTSSEGPEKKQQDSITKEFDDNYKTDDNKMKDEADPDFRKDPFKGQYQARAGSTNAIDHLSAHVYRTYLSSQTGDNAPDTRKGYEREAKSYFDALDGKTKDRYQLNIWTEYDYFDFLSSIDSASFSIKNDEEGRSEKFMKALLEKRGEFQKRAAEEEPYYKSKGSIAYRVQKWGQFESLGDTADISEDDEDFLKEVVYFNGMELYPLSFTYQGFMLPELSIRTMSARKAFEIAGNEELAKKFPGKQKSKMLTYTILDEDKSREVDKMQRVYPLNPDGKPQECHRTQKIPNTLQQTEDTEWTKKHFPSDLMGYVKEDNSDSVHMYWNKRVMCNCKYDAGFVGSKKHGSENMNWVKDDIGDGEGRGDGDRIYGKIENSLCTYDEGKLPSAFAGEDMERCEKGNRLNYKGLNDDVSSENHK